MRLPLRAAALWLLASASVAHAGDLREQVLELLNAYEDVATADELRALGDKVDVELMHIADDPHVPSSRRSRAITALGHFPGDKVRGFLESHADKADKGILRRKAVLSLAVGFGADAVPTLERALADDDELLRVAAAQALALVVSDRSTEVLRARLEREDSAAVNEAISKALEGR
jgi:HEAT repeat protein